MQRKYYVVDLIKKVFESSFLVVTPKGKVYVTPGTLFGYEEGKYFLLDKVIEKILKAVEITQQWEVDIYDVHDLLYASWIELKDILPQKQ